jgi:ankyrin repeat protein
MKTYYSLSDRVAAKKYSMVKRLLDDSLNLDLTYDNGTLFTMAIENNSYDIVKILLEYFEQNQLNSYKHGSYEYSLLKGKIRNIIEQTIEYSDISLEMKNILSPYLDFNDYRLIHAAAAGNEQEVKELLREGKIDINLKDDVFENTALHFAYQNGHSEVIKLLIKAGSDTEVVNDKGLTPKEVDKLQYINGKQCQSILYDSDQLNNIKANDTEKLELLLSQTIPVKKKYNSLPDLSSTFEHSQELDVLSLDHHNAVHTTGDLFNFDDSL